jgi:hypothetical protein
VGYSSATNQNRLENEVSGWVLESAHRYARAATILLDAHLVYESEVNAALAMELLIKSLLVTTVDNARSGTLFEQYSTKELKLRDGHNLFSLYQRVPADIAVKVGLQSQAELLELKQDVFKSLRYIYEENAPRGSDALLLQTFTWLFPQVIEHFVSEGRKDPWLMFMFKNPEMMSINR